MNHNQIFLDLTINWYTFHLWRIKDCDIEKLSKELKMNYKIIKRPKLQNNFEKINNIEPKEIMYICEMKKENNLFTEIENGQY